MARYSQRIPIVDPENPQSWGKDDITGLPVMHTDMVKYYEWRGTTLQWTGFLTHYKDVDQPNPQLVPPPLKPDPVPINNPRYLRFINTPPIPTNLAATNITVDSVDLSWDAVITEPEVTSYTVVLTANWLPNPVYYQNIVTNILTISNLIAGAPYFVAVASINSVAQSAFSNPISFTTLTS